MGCRTLGWAGIMLAAAVTARSQSPAARAAGMPDLSKKSSEHVVFFSGKVMLDDGSPPADPVRLERTCNGRALFAAWTDEKGGFSFKIENTQNDISTDDASRPTEQAADMNKPMNASAIQYSTPVTSSLKGCELQAVLAGYQADRVSLSIKSMLDSTRLGTIIMHPLSRASALAVSAVSLAAPSNAKKAYQKGLEATRAQKWDVAEAEFNKAVKLYPRYATAWYQLGLVKQNRKDAAGAIAAFKEAQSSDPKFIKLYENLTVLADRQGNWADSEKYSRMWIQLDPEDFPGAYLLNAVANARLNKPDEAERAVREGLRLDKDQKIPRLNYVLGLILMDKKQYAESARWLHKYLEMAPNAGDAPIVRENLPKIEKLAANAWGGS
ncbi:MAG TPA: tetratricopeptide repeat protein [Bryobacteraceae bacterium]|nr:tetratricopeptide repeat protein [Bryobacteraceae bacterium]